MPMKVMVNLRQKTKRAVEENVAKSSWTKEVPKSPCELSLGAKCQYSYRNFLHIPWCIHQTELCFLRGQVIAQLVLPESETFRVARLIGSISNEEIDWGFDINLGFYAVAYIVSFLWALDY